MSHQLHRLVIVLGIACMLLGLFASASADKPVSPSQESIRQALDGLDPKQTGDGVLDDVLGVIKRRGSILDGSSLDGRVANPSKPQSGATKNAAVAEQLLKASRLLESLGDPDRARQTLIKQMRDEAGSLLTEDTSR